MDDLKIEYKAGINPNLPPPIKIPPGKYEAVLQGGDIIVKNSRQAQQLYAYGSFGTFIGQRMNFANFKCFPREVRNSQLNENADIKVEAKEDLSKLENCNGVKETRHDKEWLALTSNNNFNYLGTEEALYLVELGVLSVKNPIIESNLTVDDLWKRFVQIKGLCFVKRYAVYRYFRKNGWVVRSGLSFGVDYLIYKDGPEYTHSSAGIRICDEFKDPYTVAMMRELRNCKKALIVVCMKISDNLDTLNTKCLDLINVKPLVLTRWVANKSRIDDLDSKIENEEEFED